MFKEKSINSLKVVPVQSGIGKWDKTNCKGYDITPNGPYWNTFICARKKSGKSSLINLITQIYIIILEKTSFLIYNLCIQLIEHLTTF